MSSSGYEDRRFAAWRCPSPSRRPARRSRRRPLRARRRPASKESLFGSQRAGHRRRHRGPRRATRRAPFRRGACQHVRIDEQCNPCHAERLGIRADFAQCAGTDLIGAELTEKTVSSRREPRKTVFADIVRFLPLGVGTGSPSIAPNPAPTNRSSGSPLAALRILRRVVPNCVAQCADHRPPRAGKPGRLSGLTSSRLDLRQALPTATAHNHPHGEDEPVRLGVAALVVACGLAAGSASSRLLLGYGNEQCRRRFV